MVGLSELPPDLLVLIGGRIHPIEDCMSFWNVCKSLVPKDTKKIFNSVPLLMLPEEEDDNVGKESRCREFFKIYDGTILKKRIPKASGKRCMESMGWLITVREICMSDFEMSLLHPFSGVQIKLPHRTAFSIGDVVHKAVLSANPSHTSDYVLMIIDRNSEFLYFWRPGDSVWTSVENPHPNSIFRDVVYYNGHFYAVDNAGAIRVCDVRTPQTTERRIQACVEDSEGHNRAARWRPPNFRDFYIIESQGSFFVVMQCGVAHRYGGTKKFLVFQADLAAGRLRETKDLGDTAFFLGANTSLSVQASQFPKIKPNHIYFTDGTKFKQQGGLEMGVFNLADGSILPHYEGVCLSPVCPPIWVTPTLP